MIELLVLCPWLVEDVEGVTTRMALIAALYPCQCTDLSNTPSEHIPPDVNLVLCRVRCESLVADVIAADTRCKILSRVVRGAARQERRPARDEKESAAAFLAKAGADRQAADALARVDDDEADDPSIVDAARAYCRGLTKA